MKEENVRVAGICRARLCFVLKALGEKKFSRGCFYFKGEDRGKGA